MQDRTVETEQGTIAYSAYGSGDPLVMLSGFLSDRNGWVRNGYPDLLGDYRVLSIDPLGHGQSAKPHDEQAYHAREVVNHVTAVLDAEGIDEAHIWGFSRGGQMAALCSELATDRCMSVTMGGSPVGAAWSTTLPQLLKAEPLLAKGDWNKYWESFPVPLPRALTDHFEAMNDPRALAAVTRAMPQWVDVVPGFGTNVGPVPSFAYFGTGEVFAEALREVLAGSDVHAHEGDWAGHAETMTDAPGVVAVVKGFLQTLAG